MSEGAIHFCLTLLIHYINRSKAYSIAFITTPSPSLFFPRRHSTPTNLDTPFVHRHSNTEMATDHWNDLNLHEIRESPNKGQGVFARWTVLAGTRIWKEPALLLTEDCSPLAIYTQYVNLGGLSPDHHQRFTLLSSVAHLPASSKQTLAPEVVPADTSRLDFFARELHHSHWMLDARYKRVPLVDVRLAARVVAIFDNNCFEIDNGKKDSKCHGQVPARGGWCVPIVGSRGHRHCHDRLARLDKIPRCQLT